MALQFNPPEWLIQEYMKRKQPAEIMNEGVGNAINTYAQMKQVQDTNDLRKQQMNIAQQGQAIDAAKIGYDPNNPQAYWETYQQSQSTKSRLTESEIDKNTAMADAYRSRPDAKTNGPTSLEQILADKVNKGELSLEDALKKKADVERMKATAVESVKGQKESSKLDATYSLYETARDGLKTALDKTITGPIAGRIPAFTSNQQAAEGAIAAMAPVLKQLFRVAGEGVFTDRDQEMLLKMVSQRTDRPEARNQIIQNVDNIVRAKLGKTTQVGGGKIRVSNGSETLLIDAADEAEAAQDGFRRVP